MEIQKEKIAHEKHLLSQGVDFKYLPNIQYSELENVYELIEWGEEYSEALNEINSSWCTWQAAKAQAVPEGFVVVPVQCPDPDFADMLFDELSKNAIGEFGDDLLIHFSNIDEEKIWGLMLEAAQEPANTEITIRCTNCGLEFESDYDLEQNLIDPETGEIHDGCPTCKTDAYLMDLIKYPDLEPDND